MNTKHKRAVVTLLVAIATLATMGFRAPHDDSQRVSILPDETCSALGSLTAIDLLDVLDEPCYAALVDQVEFEIDHGAAAGSVEALINRVLGQMQPTSAWPADLLELSETAPVETGLSFNPVISGRDSFATEAERGSASISESSPK